MADMNLNKNVASLDVSPIFDTYSKVIMLTGQKDENGNDIAYVAGDDSGRTLTVTNPWANQTIANDILEKIRGWAYQPYEASNALLNPAAEIGDSVDINETFGGIYQQTITFGKLYNADISAPYDEEIDHEYAYESSGNREYTRQMDSVKASLRTFSNEIAAKVERENTNEMFGWSLTADSWSVHNANGTIFKVDADGAEVTGVIKASSGMIGGFNIGTMGIYNNIESFGETGKSNGVYIGTNGIQLGENFKVDSSGNLTAASGTFKGSVNASSIIGGGSSGGGGYLSSSCFGSSCNIGYAALSSGVQASLDIADSLPGYLNGSTIIRKLLCEKIYCNAGNFYSTSGNSLSRTAAFLTSARIEQSGRVEVRLANGGTAVMYTTYKVLTGSDSIKYMAG